VTVNTGSAANDRRGPYLDDGEDGAHYDGATQLCCF
jgi:hypothetical protein